MAKLRKKQEETDYGRQMIDEQLQELEARLTAMYGQATREMVANLEKGLAEFASEDKKKREELENGIITEAEYSDWRMKHIYRTNQMKVQIEDLTQTLVNADVEAMKIINDKTPEFYASSYNFAGFKAETEAQDAGIDYDTFKIYNKDAIKYILKENPDLLPQGSVDIPEDERWNRQHISNEIAQGILQGDSIPKIADRLQSVTNMDRNAAIRNARTATTGAENKGRKDAVERVREAGIPQEEWWIATHDGRTRESHILLDGQKPDENGIYANGCAYPGDPAGEPEEIYNCRCSIGSGLPGVDHTKDADLYAKFMEENYFEDWLVVKEQRAQKEAEFQKNKEKAEERRNGKIQEAKPNYKTANNRKEAVDLLKEIGFSNVSSGVNKIDEDLFVNNVNQLSKLNSTFNAIPEGVSLKTGKMRATAYVSNGVAGKEIGTIELKLSSDYYNMNPQHLIDSEIYSKGTKWSMPFSDENAGIFAITHEYGHMLQNSLIFTEEYKEKVHDYDQRIKNALALMSQQMPSIYSRNEARTIISERDRYIREQTTGISRIHRNEIIEIARENNPDFKVLDNISTYGKKNDSEFFAEVFANSQCGEPNELGNAMNEWLRRKGYDI